MAILTHEKRASQCVPTWELLTALDPRLLDLERMLLVATQLPPAEFEEVFRLVRQRIAEVVGWFSNRRDPVLRFSDGYHVVVAHLFAIVRRSAPQLIHAAEAEL